MKNGRFQGNNLFFLIPCDKLRLKYYESGMGHMQASNYDSSERSLAEGALYYLNILFRYKIMIILVTAVITVGTIVFCYISIKLPPKESPLPNYYAAQSTILIQQNNQTDVADTILVALGVSGNNRYTSSFDNGSLVIEILRSRTLIDTLIKEFSFGERYGTGNANKGKTREAVLAHCNFTYSRTTGIIRVSFVDTDPVLAMNVVNRHVELANAWFTENRGQAKQKKLQGLEDKLNSVKNDIAVLSKRLKTLPDIDQNYAIYTSELAVQQRIYDTLSPQYEAVKLAPEIDPIFTVFEYAEIPDMKAGPQRSLLVMLSFGASFAGACLLAIVLNMIKKKRISESHNP